MERIIRYKIEVSCVRLEMIGWFMLGRVAMAKIRMNEVELGKVGVREWECMPWRLK